MSRPIVASLSRNRWLCSKAISQLEGIGIVGGRAIGIYLTGLCSFSMISPQRPTHSSQM
jgi:hypothetical protein